MSVLRKIYIGLGLFTAAVAVAGLISDGYTPGAFEFSRFFVGLCLSWATYMGNDL
jgi:hypothetical protein